MAAIPAVGLVLHEDSRPSTRTHGRDYVRGRKRGEFDEEEPSHQKPLPALGNPPPPQNAVPAGKLGEADHGPSNSASAIDSIMMRRDEQPANRDDPTSPPQVQLIWPLISIPGAGVPAPVDNERTIDMDGNSFSCRGRLKV